MKLAIFDLDNTLIAGDSDLLWGLWLAERGLVDGASHKAKQERFYREYTEGRLDTQRFLEFQLGFLAKHDAASLEAWRRDYVRESIQPIILPAARELVESHRRMGHRLLTITATNAFLTKPIIALFGIDELIATDPEFVDGRYTGRVIGIPAFAEGKVQRLRMWLQERNETPEESWFYSDSRNDIPLLEQVDHPVAVDPDDALRQVAQDRGWQLISLRQG